MTSKRVKAWAVVTERGSLWSGFQDALIFRTKKAAEFMVSDSMGERVVPVTIIVEES
jgi:hypothetical protein